MRIQRNKWNQRRRGCGIVLGAGLLLTTGPALAATILVNSTADPGNAGDGNCSLREAVANANSNTDTTMGDCAAGEAATTDVINFAGSVIYPLTAGQLLITDAVSFNESGQTPTIDAGGNSRIFMNTSTLTLNNLTLVNGTVTGDGASGGAILNGTGGVLTVNGGAMNNNTAVRAGGAIEEASGAPAGTVAVTLNNVDFSGNNAGMAPGNGGVLHVSGAADIVVSGGTFSNNTAMEGGALWNNGGTMTITDATFTGNTANGSAADTGGGALFGQNGAGGTINVTNSTFDGNQAAGGVSSGGAIFVGEGSTLSVSGGSMTNNTANRAGGAIEVRDVASVSLDGVTIDGNTANTTATGGGGNGGALHVTGAGNVGISNSQITGNIAAAEGGGLWNNAGTMTIDGSTISGNAANGTAADNGGGGVFNNAGGGSGGTVIITDSTVSNNTANNGSGSGGGILNAEGGVLNVTNSVIANNEANRAGGGIETRGGAGNQVTLTDVALVGNVVNNNPGNGGGLHGGADANVDVTNSLVANNAAGFEGGGLWIANGALNIDGSRIANNVAQGDRLNGGGGGGGIVVNGSGTANISGNTLIVGNAATGIQGSGGGIFNKADGTVNVFDSRISANSASRAGGGIENAGGTVSLLRATLGGASPAAGNMAGTDPGNGGGLHTGGSGVVTIADSVVAYNTASEGGGLWNSGAGSLSVNNSTISNNQATVSTGGGVHQDGNNGTTSLTYVTVARNSAAGAGGGVAAPGGSTVMVESSIIAGDVAGTTVSDSNTVTSGAMLADLQLFGGPTATHPLTPGSAADDAGSATVCANPPIDGRDQRGAQRGILPASIGTCDAGAFEITDDPVVAVTDNASGVIDVNPGDQDVVVLDLTLANNNSSSVTVNDLSGTVVVTAGATGLLDGASYQVVIDGNGNGQFDGSDTPVSGANVIVSGTRLTVDFSGFGGQLIAAGASPRFLVGADLPSTSMASLALPTTLAGGGLLLGLLAMFRIGAVRRRWQLLLLAAAVAAAVAGCGGDGGGGDDNNGNPPAQNLQGDVQFRIDQINAQGGNFLIGDGLPVTGAGLDFPDN